MQSLGGGLLTALARASPCLSNGPFVVSKAFSLFSASLALLLLSFQLLRRVLKWEGASPRCFLLWWCRFNLEVAQTHFRLAASPDRLANRGHTPLPYTWPSTPAERVQSSISSRVNRPYLTSDIAYGRNYGYRSVFSC